MNDLIQFSPVQTTLQPPPRPQWVNYVLQAIHSLLQTQSTITVHRSKLFSLFDDFRTLEKTFDPDLSLPQETLKTQCSLIIDAINRTKQMVYYTSAAHWSQPAVTWQSGTMRDTIRRIREDVHESLMNFRCKNTPTFLVNDDELNAQNDVDMLQLKGSLLDYLSHIQGQVQTPQIQNVVALINERVRSIGPLEGLQDGPALVCVPPFLPAKLNYVLTHDQFTVGKKIGSGTFGSVHIGYMNNNNMKKVAVKVLNTQVLGGRQLETFKREVWTMATLNHPSILRLIGVTLTPPFCIITELLKCSLYDRMKFLSPTKRSMIALKVAQGMEQLHAARIIHRDLKSANILLDEEDNPRVCDFGLVGFKTGNTKTGYVGTAQWMAPEVLRSSPFYDEKVDVYSFGVLLWEMLTLQEPYAGMKQDQIIMAVIEQQMRPPIGQQFGPPRLIQLIESCWQEDPTMRPPFSAITGLLMQPDFHFIGTNEQEFQQLIPSTLISVNLLQAYDSQNWGRLTQLISKITSEEIEKDHQLIPALLTLFSGLSVDLQVHVVQMFPTILDFELFVAQKGYTFTVSLFSMQPPVVSALVQSLRSIDLSSKAFRQVKLINCLATSTNPDVTQLCADLCEYPDIAEYIASNSLPINNNNDREILWLYHNLLLHPQVIDKVSSQSEVLYIASRKLEEIPFEVCQTLQNYRFNGGHVQIIAQLQLVKLLVHVCSRNMSAMNVLKNILYILPQEALIEQKDIILPLVKNHRFYFRELDLKFSHVEGYELSTIDWSQALN